MRSKGYTITIFVGRSAFACTNGPQRPTISAHTCARTSVQHNDWPRYGLHRQRVERTAVAASDFLVGHRPRFSALRRNQIAHA